MAITPEQQKQLNKMIEEMDALQARIAKNGRAGRLQAERMVELEKNILKLQEEQLKKSKELLSLEKQEEKLQTSMDKKIRSITYSQKDKFGLEEKYLKAAKDSARTITDIAANQESSSNRSKEINDLSQEGLNLIESINAGHVDQQGLRDAEAELTGRLKDETLELSDAEKDILKELLKHLKVKKDQNMQEKIATIILEDAQDLYEQGLATLKSQAAQWLTIGGLIGVAKNMFSKFNELTGAAGKEFGALGMRAEKLRDEITLSGPELTRMGSSITDMTGSMTTLSSEFGIGLSRAADIGVAILDSSKAMGLSAEEGTKLFGTMMSITGASQENTEKLLEATASLAMQNDVAPQAVMQDLANNGEFFAANMKDGGKNILMAAIQAKKLGIDLNKVSNIAKGLLDFESSLNAEMEASVMIGRRINLDKARQLALTGDMEGMMGEVLKQVGGQAEFDRLNVLQREKLAQAIGVGSEDLAKFVSGMQEEKEVMGEIDEQNKLNNITAAETLTKFDKLLNDIKAMGEELAVKLGPGMMGLVEQFGKLVNWLGQGENAMNAFTAALSISFAKTMSSVAANIALASAKTAAWAPGIGLIAAGLGGAAMWMGVKSMISEAQSSYGKAFRGANFVTNGPGNLTVGDNPGGRERVSVTPISSPNFDGPNDNLTLRFINSNLNELVKEQKLTNTRLKNQSDEHTRTFGPGGLVYSQGIKITESAEG